MSFTPPVTRDAWSYSGDFHVEVSGNNRHRRATVAELKAVFDGSDGSKDRPAHWYEAQLIHYGLPPSKTKGTAKMRLFDAVNKGHLAVPAQILRVEAGLKKEWTKREREAKKLSAPAKASNKRKADDAPLSIGPGTNVNINLSVSVGPHGNVQIATAAPAPKKAKTTKTGTDEKPPKVKGTPTPSAARKSFPANKTTVPASASNPPSVPAPRTKQTARRGTSSSSGRGGKSVTSRPASAAPSSTPAARPIQTARRSRPFNRTGQGRPAGISEQAPSLDATPSPWDSYDDPPPPYPGSPMQLDDGYSHRDLEDQGEYDGPLPPLGLLNGRYQLRCTGPSEFADRGEDSGIIFTLDGNALWGSFEIGPVSGILRLDGRPWQSSHQPLYFQWRGEDSQGGDHAETNDGSYLKFLGNGEIAGKIGFYKSMLEFEGYRVSGQETRSEISAFAMRRQWDQRL